MQRVGIPTASWRAFDEVDDALAHAEELGWRCVVKADGLAAGKGSFVCESEAEATHAINTLLVEKRFGTGPILLEEILSGQEVSVFAISDGATVVPFGAAQDHKRALDDDLGPNTGGMGAYSPVDHMQVAQDFAASFFQPIVTTLAAEGTPYVGVLYAGAIVTQQGPKILEFNCRFGDPEAEVLLCRLESDLAEILKSACDQRLHTLAEVVWKPDEALCVVIAGKNYPDEQDIGTPIIGVDAAAKVPGVVLFHAGTDTDDGQLVTHGGRILAITGMGRDLSEARSRAYDAVQQVTFDGARYRRDIGAKAIGTVWTAEWRKPPRWEVSVSLASEAIGQVARDLDALRSTESTDGPHLERLRDRLYEIKLVLQSTPADAADALGSTRNVEFSASPDQLSELTAGFDELFVEMQNEDVRRAVDEGFHSTPRQISEKLRRLRAQEMPSAQRKRV